MQETTEKSNINKLFTKRNTSKSSTNKNEVSARAVSANSVHVSDVSGLGYIRGSSMKLVDKTLDELVNSLVICSATSAVSMASGTIAARKLAAARAAKKGITPARTAKEVVSTARDSNNIHVSDVSGLGYIRGSKIKISS
jgi:hypothetical protein